MDGNASVNTDDERLVELGEMRFNLIGGELITF